MNNMNNKDYLVTKGLDETLANIILIHSDPKTGHNLLEFLSDNREGLGDSILNIGLSNDACSHSWVSFFLDVLLFKTVTILEFHKPNYDAIVEKYKDNEKVKVVWGDVRQASEFIEESSDCCFWWHGPEHIPLDDLPKALEELKSLSEKAILWACPWGSYYGVGPGLYLGDGHHYYPENEHFSSLGMNVFNTGGDHNTGNANIVAYIIKGDESW